MLPTSAEFDPKIVAAIERHLRSVHDEHHAGVLLAIESGSRAWGFPSPDSDYDCRFIFVRRRQDYLSLFPVRDVIEFSPDGILDVNGWDLGKALRAAAEDAPIAAAFGVNERALAYLLSGVSAALAGAAGVCIALSYTLAPAQIYAWIGVIFAVVMLGGVGRPLGPLVAGIVIGVSEALTMAVTAPSWAPLVSFSLLIAVLILRPGKV